MNCIVTAGHLRAVGRGAPAHELFHRPARHGTRQFLGRARHKVTLLAGEQSTYSGERRAQRVEIFTTTADLRARLKTLASRRMESDFFTAAAVRRLCLPANSGCARQPANWPNSNPPKKFRRVKANCLSNWRNAKKSCLNCARGSRRRASWAGNSRRTARAPTPSNAARQQITECHTDACVVNGPAYGEGFGVLLRQQQAAHLPHSAGVVRDTGKKCPSRFPLIPRPSSRGAPAILHFVFFPGFAAHTSGASRSKPTAAQRRRCFPAPTHVRVQAARAEYQAMRWDARM